MALNGKAAAAAAWCFGFIHEDVKLMELRSVEKIQKKNRLTWNQKNKFWFTDKRIKICLQPCFRFVKAKLLHRVCLLQLPLGSNLAGTQTQDSKQTKQWTLFSERSAELAANEKAEEGLGFESTSRCWGQTSASWRWRPQRTCTKITELSW